MTALSRPFVAEVVISNPLRTRAIAEAKVKTDRVDALVLARLLRADYLPRVWHADAQTRQLRQQTTERAALVRDRTRLKNRVHSVLHQRLIAAPAGDLFSRRGRAWLKQLELIRQDAGPWIAICGNWTRSTANSNNCKRCWQSRAIEIHG